MQSFFGKGRPSEEAAEERPDKKEWEGVELDG